VAKLVNASVHGWTGGRTMLGSTPGAYFLSTLHT